MNKYRSGWRLLKDFQILVKQGDVLIVDMKKNSK